MPAVIFFIATSLMRFSNLRALHYILIQAVLRRSFVTV